MEFIYEMIDISNYLLINYWYIILPVATAFAVFMTYLKFKLENKDSNNEDNKK